MGGFYGFHLLASFLLILGLIYTLFIRDPFDTINASLNQKDIKKMWQQPWSALKDGWMPQL